MKKILTIALTIAIVGSMSIAALAASPSVSAPEPTPAPVEQPGNITPSVPNASAVTASAGVKVENWDGTGAGAFYEYINSVAGAQLIGAFELSGKTGSVTLSMPGVVAGGKYAVLHYTNGKMVSVPVTAVGAGSITFTAASFSPYAIVALPAGAKSPNTSADPYASTKALVLAISAVSLIGMSAMRFSRVR